MTPRRQLVLCAVALGVALVAQALLARLLAATDVPSELLGPSPAPTALGIVALLGVRLWLVFVAPGWLLYSLVLLCIERRGFRGVVGPW